MRAGRAGVHKAVNSQKSKRSVELQSNSRAARYAVPKTPDDYERMGKKVADLIPTRQKPKEELTDQEKQESE